MAVNAACERVEGALEQTLTSAKSRGELAREKDPRRLAGFLLTALQGLRVVGKAQPQRLRDAVQVILSTLD